MNPAQILADHQQANIDARQFVPSAPKPERGQVDFCFGLSDFEVTVHCNYSEGERMTRDCPGEPESVEVAAVYLYDVDISEIVPEDAIERMEFRCWEVIKERRDEAAIDRYESSLDY